MPSGKVCATCSRSLAPCSFKYLFRAARSFSSYLVRYLPGADRSKCASLKHPVAIRSGMCRSTMYRSNWWQRLSPTSAVTSYAITASADFIAFVALAKRYLDGRPQASQLRLTCQSHASQLCLIRVSIVPLRSHSCPAGEAKGNCVGTRLGGVGAEAMDGNSDEFGRAIIDIVVGVHLAELDHPRIRQRRCIFD